MSENEVREFQKPLFIESPDGLIQWKDFHAPENLHALAMSGDVGPYARVEERAEYLIQVMNKLAHRNMLLGLDVAGNDPELNTEILDRYAEGAPVVLQLSEAKGHRLYQEAQHDFWRATGFEALRGTGLTIGMVRGRLRKMWRDFRHDVAHPKVHKELVKLRRTQEKFLPIDHPLREENRLAKYRKDELQEQQVLLEV